MRNKMSKNIKKGGIAAVIVGGVVGVAVNIMERRYGIDLDKEIIIAAITGAVAAITSILDAVKHRK